MAQRIKYRKRRVSAAAHRKTSRKRRGKIAAASACCAARHSAKQQHHGAHNALRAIRSYQRHGCARAARWHISAAVLHLHPPRKQRAKTK